MKPHYIVIHTAAWDGRGADVAIIRAWHIRRGWSDIGYHYVIIDDTHPDLPDGTLQQGRDENTQGAHALGINEQSIGICLAGNGDKHPPTRAQLDTLSALCTDICTRHQILPGKIIGHREINNLIQAGIIDAPKTRKTCPGAHVDMAAIRADVRARLASIIGHAMTDETLLATTTAVRCCTNNAPGAVIGIALENNLTGETIKINEGDKKWQ